MQLELDVHEQGKLYEALTWTIARIECAEATRSQHGDHRRWLVEFFGDVPLAALTFAEVTRYIEHEKARGIANVTLRKRLVTLRMGLDDAYRRGLLPTKIDWWPRLTGDSKPSELVWTYQQYRQGRLAFEPDQRIGIDVMFWTGMHVSDLRRWRRGDVDLAGRRWRRYNTKSKAEPRWLPLPAEFADILTDWFAHRGILADSQVVAPEWWASPVKPMARVCVRAGLPRITPNGLRSSCVSHQFDLGVEKGQSPDMIMQFAALWLGHKGDPRTSDIIRRHYLKWSEKTVKVAAPYNF